MNHRTAYHLLAKHTLLILAAIASSAVDAQSNPPSDLKKNWVPSGEASYAQRLILSIKRNIVWKTEGDISDAICEVEAVVDTQGWIVSRRALKSQGHPEWCPTVLRALDRTERIPSDADGRFPPKLSITFYGKE